MGYCFSSAYRRLARRAQEWLCILYVYFVFFSFLFSLLSSCVGYGWAGTAGYIDPEMGIAVVFASQVVPTDGVAFVWGAKFEQILYANLK